MRAVFAFALVALVPAAAAGQSFPCAPAEALERALYDTYGEVPFGMGYMDETAQFRILVAPGGRTWSALIVTADGLACLVNGGEHWRPAPAPAAKGRES